MRLICIKQQLYAVKIVNNLNISGTWLNRWQKCNSSNIFSVWPFSTSYFRSDDFLSMYDRFGVFSISFRILCNVRHCERAIETKRTETGWANELKIYSLTIDWLLTTDYGDYEKVFFVFEQFFQMFYLMCARAANSTEIIACHLQAHTQF